MWSDYKKEVQALMKLILPLILTGLVGGLVYFFETIFLAHLNIEALAAGALVSWLYSVFVVIVFGILSAINILISHQYGGKNTNQIGLILRDGIFLSFILFVISFIIFWHMPPIFLLLGQNSIVVSNATPYLHALAWGLMPSFLMIALLEFMMGLGHTRVLMFFTALNVILSIGLSYVLIFGLYGFKKFGIAGAGWGISLSHFISFILLCSYCLSQKKYHPYLKILTQLQPFRYLRELNKLGLPLGMMYSIEVGYFFALSILVGHYGHQALAANQIALQYLGVMVGVIFSVSQGVTVRMGHLMGANQFLAAKRACYMGVLIVCVLAAVVGLLELIFSRQLISLDFDIHAPQNRVIVLDAILFIFLAVIFQILEAFRLAILGALRALKDTQYCLWISIVTFWFIALPIGAFFSKILGYGIFGLWYGVLFAVLLGSILLYKRFSNMFSLK